MILLKYILIFAILVVAELVYFRIADKYNIIDKPNERSSHSTIVLRGGGILFTLAVILWALYQIAFGEHADATGFEVVVDNLPFVVGLIAVATVSFVDDVAGTSNKTRLVMQCLGAVLMLVCLAWPAPMFDVAGVFGSHPFGLIGVGVVSTIATMGIMNVYNFMDGINGITGGYSLVALATLFVINEFVLPDRFMIPSLLVFEIIALLIFCFFNFRQKGKAKCFAGDVGSVAIAFVILYAMARLMVATGAVTWIVLLVVYGIDGCLTICHRIMLHENLGEAHRKHAYQLMANELKIGAVTISSLYMALQLIINMVMIFVIPNTATAHWIYLVGVIVVLSLAYILFMKKYYHLHAEYLESLKTR